MEDEIILVAKLLVLQKWIIIFILCMNELLYKIES